MDISKSTIMQLMEAQMRYHSQRQVVLSQNIANIDTPGYRARDVQKVNFEDLVRQQAHRLEMRATSAKHQEGIKPFSGPYRDEVQRETYETTPEENSVSLDEQMAKISENNTQNQLTTNLLRKYVSMYHTAAVGSR